MKSETSFFPAYGLPGQLRTRSGWPAVRATVAEWAAVAGAALFSVLWGCRSFGVQDNNEGLYAEVAREMVAGHDWILPHLNGVPYLEKPPVLYWLVAALLRVFGDYEWVVRLGPALCFGGTLAAVMYLGRLAGRPKAGRAAALLMCSATGIVVMSRSLLFDGPLACVLAWALAAFLRWRLTGGRGSLRAAYALLAVGVMTKGALALCLGGGAMLVSTVLADRSWRGLRTLWDGWGVVLFAAIAVPWHVLAALRDPGFVDFYIVNEHVRRFLGTRQPRDYYSGPWFYYLVRIPLYLGVWGAVGSVLLIPRPHAGRRMVTRRLRETRRVLASVALLALGFFSISEGKANYYLLPVMPAVALLIALAWPADGIRSRRLLSGAVSLLLFAVLVGGAPIWLARKPELAAVLRANTVFLTAVGLALVALAVIVWQWVQRGRNAAAFSAMTAGGLLILLPLPPLLAAADPLLSQRQLVELVRRAPRRNLVFYRDYERFSSVPFYLGRTVPIVDCASNELYYSCRHHAGRGAFLNETAFRTLAAHGAVWLVTTPGREAEALQRFQALTPRVVRRSPTAVLLVVGSDAGVGAGMTDLND